MSNTQPIISIIMPIFNGIEYISESVNSVLNQSFKNWELIIGINGHHSDSEVYKTAKKYESTGIHVYDLYEIKGKSNACNYMLQFCKADYIAILDVDDIWYNNKLESQIPYLETYDVIGTRCIYFGDKEGIIPNIPTGNITYFDFISVNPIINSSAVIRKKLCYWDNNFNGVEDYDLWLRLRTDNKKFYNLSEVLVKHRIHQDSAFNAKDQTQKLNSLIIKYTK